MKLYNKKSIRKKIGYISEYDMLFSGTIYDNSKP